MRGLITAICVAAVLVVSTVWYAHATTEISGNLMDMNRKIEESIRADNFDAALRDIKQLDEYTDKKRPLLSVVGNHEQLDKIETSIRELSGYAEGGMKTEAQVVCRALAAMLEQIPRDYKITPENIF